MNPMFPPTEGRTAGEIVTSPFIPDSAGHIHSALSWHDLAERENRSIALLYSAIHLRLCIEHLWFEIFQAATGNAISTGDFERAVKEATKLYKLVDERTPQYIKFCRFTQLMASLDSQPHVPSIIWDISRLKRIHGETSSRLLHFTGSSSHGIHSPQWAVEQSAYLKSEATWIWAEMRTRGNLVVLKLEGLEPEVLETWEEYKSHRIDIESARIRLDLLLPMLRARYQSRLRP